MSNDEKSKVRSGNSAPRLKTDGFSCHKAYKINQIINNNVLLAVGVGFIPSPLFDSIAIAGIELKMIDELAKAYAFPFPNKLGLCKIIISLVGSIGPVYLTHNYPYLFKKIPLIGYVMTVSMMSVSGGISVYVVGKIFQKHFESGGTFLGNKNNHHSVKQYAEKQYQQGKTIVPELIRKN